MIADERSPRALLLASALVLTGLRAFRRRPALLVKRCARPTGRKEWNALRCRSADGDASSWDLASTDVLFAQIKTSSAAHSAS